MKKTLQSYDVSARIHSLAGISIKAESYEDALEQAKALSVTDFITFKDQHVDSSIIIGGISKSNYWNIDQE